MGNESTEKKITGLENETTDMATLIKLFTNALGEKKKMDIRMKEPDTYDGTRNASVIDGWIKSIERYSDFYNLNDAKTGLLALTLLRGRADAWYRTIEANNNDGTSTSVSWLQIKRELIAFFRPDNATRLARDRMASLVQTGDLMDFVNGFMNLKLDIPNMTDEEAIDKFVRGLRDRDLRAHVRQVDPITMRDAIHAAMAFDSARYETDFTPSAARTFAGSSARNQDALDDPMELDAMDGRRNYRNGARNNDFRNNGGRRFGSGRFGSSRGGSRSSHGGNARMVTCYFCNKQGHYMADCRQRQDAIRRLVDEPNMQPKRSGNGQGFQ